MPKITKNIVDSNLRERIFEDLMNFGHVGSDYKYTKINDRQYGTLITDLNGVERYVRIGVIVAEEREDCTARKLMEKEIDEYNEKQAVKAQKAAERAEKAERDKAERAAKKKEKEEREKEKKEEADEIRTIVETEPWRPTQFRLNP